MWTTGVAAREDGVSGPGSAPRQVHAPWGPTASGGTRETPSGGWLGSRPRTGRRAAGVPGPDVGLRTRPRSPGLLGGFPARTRRRRRP